MEGILRQLREIKVSNDAREWSLGILPPLHLQRQHLDDQPQQQHGVQPREEQHPDEPPQQQHHGVQQQQKQEHESPQQQHHGVQQQQKQEHESPQQRQQQLQKSADEKDRPMMSKGEELKKPNGFEELPPRNLSRRNLKLVLKSLKTLEQLRESLERVEDVRVNEDRGRQKIKKKTQRGEKVIQKNLNLEIFITKLKPSYSITL